jgi:hypothetical protein
MRATSHTAPGPVQTPSRPLCEGRTRTPLSLLHNQKKWTKRRGPVSSVKKGIQATLGCVKSSFISYLIRSVKGIISNCVSGIFTGKSIIGNLTRGIVRKVKGAATKALRFVVCKGAEDVPTCRRIGGTP